MGGRSCWRIGGVNFGDIRKVEAQNIEGEICGRSQG